MACKQFRLKQSNMYGKTSDAFFDVSLIVVQITLWRILIIKNKLYHETYAGYCRTTFIPLKKGFIQSLH